MPKKDPPIGNKMAVARWQPGSVFNLFRGVEKLKERNGQKKRWLLARTASLNSQGNKGLEINKE